MILILTYEEYEQGTDPVVDYLTGMGASFMRLSLDALLSSRSEIYIDVLKEDVLINGKSLISEINVIWYRRFFHRPGLDGEEIDESQFKLSADLDREFAGIFQFLFRILGGKKWLPGFEAAAVNKLDVLKTAHRLGIRVPRTALMNNRRGLLEFCKTLPVGLVTKPVHGAAYYPVGEDVYVSLVTRLNLEDINRLPAAFPPSLFQEFIEKEYELKVFYICGLFFPSALQTTEKGRQMGDIKNARLSEEVCCMPYNLSKKEEHMLNGLMESLSLNTGTIDLIKSGNELTLLEVNPGGQYLYESQQNNQYVNKVIAEWLMENDTAHVSI